MKKLILFSALLIFACSYGQGEQLYADGTETDQDGNSFEWINYGIQDWAIDNAEVVTYRDGTEIPQVTDPTQWINLTTGAWCYYDNDPNKDKLYNWYAVVGIHDDDPNTPNKEFAPDGWHVPSDAEWSILAEYLIANGYNFDGSSYSCSPCPQVYNKIAESLASNSGWNPSTNEGTPGYDQSANNSSGFNALPVGYRNIYVGSFMLEGDNAIFMTSSEDLNDYARDRTLVNSYPYLVESGCSKTHGFSVRFVRDDSTASIENNQSNTITIYPNPTTSILTIKGSKEYNIKVFDITGRKIMTHTGNTIDMSNLSPATYIIKAVDNSNNEELTYKVIKD